MSKSIISVNNLKKYYSIFQKEPGLLGSLKSLISRKYSDVKAVDGVSFTIEEGELVGFIGPNGAGKTTTLKVLSGLLYPSSGQIEVFGKEPFKREKEFQKNISLIMGQKNQLWWDLPAMDSFILNKEIYEIDEESFRDNVKKLSEMLRVEDILTVPVRKLSLGQRMKCELIAALLHSPKVLFLDEPTIGLDVIAQQNMRDFIKDYNEEFKATIILTSHYMGDVEKLCKRVIVINKGKIIYDGSLEKIVNKFAPYKLIKADIREGFDLNKLKNIGKIVQHFEDQVSLEVEKSKIADKTSQLLSQFEIADLTIEEPAIEDIVRQIFSNKEER
ncbi:ABC transporter ATP-binding protein [Candidatus Daviesbacteria bacterium]|nr:ABC transporter ATP-binding protein [Candidatus Daviesbacteria bacterium]